MREVLTEDDFLFVSVEELVNPAKGGFFLHHLNGWWVLHPEKGAAFYSPRCRDGGRRHSDYGRPQYNSDERIARSPNLTSHLPWEPEVRLIPSAWTPVNLSYYQHG